MSAIALLPTALAGKVMRSVVSVRPFVFTLTFEPTDFWPFLLVWWVTITRARRGLKVIVINEGQALGLGSPIEGDSF